MKRIGLLIVATTLVFIGYAQDEALGVGDYNAAVEIYNEARFHYDVKEFDSALHKFSKAYTLNPNAADYPFGIATTYYELNKYDSASRYIEKAIYLESNQPDYHYHAGNIYFKLKDYQSAFGNYSKALDNISEEIPINESNCRFNRGVSAFYLKEYNSAITDLNWIIEMDSGNYTAIHLRGVSYLKSNNKKEACKDFQTAYGLSNEKSNEYINRYCK